MKKLLFILGIVACTTAQAQLANGSTAPNFTLQDYYGNTHTLYNYLDNGKTVFLEIFAAHCPSCWSYHQTHRLKNMYNLYGPPGTNQIMVLALEHDPYNDSTAFTGDHEPWVTQGNWLDGTPFPIFNVEGTDRSVFTDYNVTFYPVIYKICPNKILERVNTNVTEPQLYQLVQGCATFSLEEENNHHKKIYVNENSQKLIIDFKGEIRFVSIFNINGQEVMHSALPEQNSVEIATLAKGIYIVVLETESAQFVEKISVR